MTFGSDLTVCICTRDRPDDLERAILSVAKHAPAARVVVADDGGGSARAICERYGQCRWVAGPERGLGANRNAAVKAAETNWILFLDDDARIGEAFVPAIEDCLEATSPELRERTVLTGRERKGNVLVDPHDVDFLGFQRRAYRPGDSLRTVVINAAVWPRALFERIHFDEGLLYGSDEVDISYSALRAGYRIELCPSAINYHDPSPSGRDGYSIAANVSRLRAGVRRNRFRHPLKGVLFAVIAPLHLIATEIWSGGIEGLLRSAEILRRWLHGSVEARAAQRKGR